MKKIFIKSAAILAGSLLLFINCFTVTNFETAQTAGSGNFEFGGSFSPVMMLANQSGSNAVILPFADISAKLGITDRFDIGARWALPFGIYANTKYQFLRNGIDGALFLEGSYFGPLTGSDAGFYTINPAVIFSREQEGTFPFSVLLGFFTIGIGSENTTALKANIGFPFRIGNNRSVRIMPEIGILHSFGEEIDIFSDNEGSTIFQFGVGFRSVK